VLRTWWEFEGKEKKRKCWNKALCVEDKAFFERSMLRKQLGENEKVEGFQRWQWKPKYNNINPKGRNSCDHESLRKKIVLINYLVKLFFS